MNPVQNQIHNRFFVPFHQSSTSFQKEKSDSQKVAEGQSDALVGVQEENASQSEKTSEWDSDPRDVRFSHRADFSEFIKLIRILSSDFI